MKNTIKENDFVKREFLGFTGNEIINFKHIPKTYEKPQYDWYMVVAIEKADKVKLIEAFSLLNFYFLIDGQFGKVISMD